MSIKIVIDWKGKGGKQIPWFPTKTDEIRVPFQKGVEPNKEIVIDKILQRGEEFGQPYLPIKLICEMIKNGRNKKIHGMKYKAKKRTKRTWGHQELYTEIRVKKFMAWNIKENSWHEINKRTWGHQELYTKNSEAEVS